MKLHKLLFAVVALGVVNAGLEDIVFSADAVDHPSITYQEERL